MGRVGNGASRLWGESVAEGWGEPVLGRVDRTPIRTIWTSLAYSLKKSCELFFQFAPSSFPVQKNFPGRLLRAVCTNVHLYENNIVVSPS